MSGRAAVAVCWCERGGRRGDTFREGARSCVTARDAVQLCMPGTDCKYLCRCLVLKVDEGPKGGGGTALTSGRLQVYQAALGVLCRTQAHLALSCLLLQLALPSLLLQPHGAV